MTRTLIIVYIPLDSDRVLLNEPVRPCWKVKRVAGLARQSAGTLSSHFACTDIPHNLHVLPCFASPHIDDYRSVSQGCSVPKAAHTPQEAQGVGMENAAPLNVCICPSPRSSPRAVVIVSISVRSNLWDRL